jgi:nitrogen fixation protein FixH
MRLRLLAAASLAAFLLFATACNTGDYNIPNPTSLINQTRDRLDPFRFTFATDPEAPRAAIPFTLRVHVIDAAGQPAEGVDLEADLSTTGMGGSPQHLTFDDTGAGDYTADVTLPDPGGWDVKITAAKEGKSKHQSFHIEVSG